MCKPHTCMYMHVHVYTAKATEHTILVQVCLFTWFGLAPDFFPHIQEQPLSCLKPCIRVGFYISSFEGLHACPVIVCVHRPHIRSLHKRVCLDSPVPASSQALARKTFLSNMMQEPDLGVQKPTPTASVGPQTAKTKTKYIYIYIYI